MNNTFDMFGADRFYCAQLQVFNWGTFDKLTTVAIAKKGHFLTGPSGAGKSTLLDARAVIMTPPRQLDFNAASRDGTAKSKDRNLVSYIRGTWGEQTDKATGELAKQHNRPGATWSAIAETYTTEQGRRVTLAQLYWISDSGCTPKDVNVHYIVADRGLDLRELDVFAKSGFSLKALKQAVPDVYYAPDFKSYCERFRHRFSIESDLALKLLHKTQSAKNLDDLDDFLRNFMLDRPKTFEVAESLVTEFAQLNSAHKAVVDARDQVNLLRPAREANMHRDQALLRLNEINDIHSARVTYRKILNRSLLRTEVDRLTVQRDGLKADLAEAQQKQWQDEGRLKDLDLRHLGLGGKDIQSYEADIERLRGDSRHCGERRKAIQKAYEQLGWDFPGSGNIYAMQQAIAAEELEKHSKRDTSAERVEQEMIAHKATAERDMHVLRSEISAMEAQRSNIPSDMLAMRRMIAAGVNVSEEDLPFVGELLEVKKSESNWNGAIERVLRGFALSILVDDRNTELCDAVGRFVNENDMRGRVVYLRTEKNDILGVRSLKANHLVTKLDIKSGRWESWLYNELVSSFAFECVESVGALQKCDRGVTQEGQVKQNRRRYEKDDRTKIGDRSRWVMGFDNAEKIALYKTKYITAAEKYEALRAKIEASKEAERVARARIGPCQKICDASWGSIDQSGVEAALKKALSDLSAVKEGNIELAEIDDKRNELRAVLKDLNQVIAKLGVGIENASASIGALQLQLQSLELDVSIYEPTPAQKAGLDERYGRLESPVTLASLAQNAAEVDSMLLEERSEQQGAIHKAERKIEQAFQHFKSTFPVKAENLGDTVDFAPDYMAMLDRLEKDNLPGYVEEFMRLLDTQSWQQLIALSTHITEALKEISERLEIVNDSLSSVNFNVGTTIRIEKRDKNLSEVRDFRSSVKEALAHSASDDAEAAESRFVVIQKIVKRFGSQDAVDVTWRNKVLDVREHVEFIGREYDSAGNEVESYGRDSGKSGGQKQKLAVTCLAAALRYQLGGTSECPPAFSTVVLDEAFTRSDNTFTQQCMQIFQSFGFQMIIATPVKSVMALEPYVGGATFVTIRDRRWSESKDICYDEASSRLQLSDELRGMLDDDMGKAA